MSTSLEARSLVKDYRLRSGFKTTILHAVKDASFVLEPGRTVALVGESGSGKSTIARMLAKLERPTSGRILLDGRDSGVRGQALARYRSDVQMVFQDPFASLNPFHSIAHHLERPLRIHHPELTDAQVRARTLELLERVRLTPADKIADRRPHELSGGQRQRVAIARALAPGARFIITHDLATARHFSDEILVMYHGDIVERGPADEVILRPQHDYTKTLLNAAPEPENLGRLRDEVRRELAAKGDRAG